MKDNGQGTGEGLDRHQTQSGPKKGEGKKEERVGRISNRSPAVRAPFRPVGNPPA